VVGVMGGNHKTCNKRQEEGTSPQSMRSKGIGSSKDLAAQDERGGSGGGGGLEKHDVDGSDGASDHEVEREEEIGPVPQAQLRTLHRSKREHFRSVYSLGG
jgi:hypothetical protein